VALTRLRLDQSQGSDPPDRVSDGGPRNPVLLPQLELGPQLLAGLECAGLIGYLILPITYRPSAPEVRRLFLHLERSRLVS
jgi:hypothetical protein